VSSARIAVVVKGYPRLSETFIAQEIRELERRGLDLVIVSLRRPYDPDIHPIHREIRAPVLYLPEYLYEEPARVLRAWRRLRRRRGYGTMRAAWLRDLRRDPSANRGRRFGQALVLAAELPDDVAHLHVHYLHTPASVTRYGAMLTGLPFSISAHAKDLWLTPEWEKREKLEAARWLTTCTASGAAHLRKLAPGTEVVLNYHGLDARRFAVPEPRPERHGRDPEDPVRLLGVGRLVPKKGVDVLLDALAALPSGLHWRYVHVGGGPMRTALEAKAEQLGLGGRIDWLGAKAHDEVLAAYRAADVFVLASRIAKDGDRDGLPNVLLEAGSQELPVVATEVAAIPELIEDGVNGRLVPPDEPAALASVLEALMASPSERRRLGQAARQRILAAFTLETRIEPLAARLRRELSDLRPAAE